MTSYLGAVTTEHTALIHPSLSELGPLELSTFSRLAGLHPDFILRLVSLGLLQAHTDSSGRLLFEPEELAAVARIQRLRAGFCLNYAAIGLVVDLLDRIEELEAAQQHAARSFGG